jgi:class 3 adenylate cyclase
LLIGVITSTMLSGLVVGSFVVEAGSGANGLVRMYVIGGAAGIGIGLVAVVLILLTVLGPIRQLIGGTIAVGRGDLSVELPPVSADELGILMGTFNDMVRGLREREALHSAMGSYVDPAIAGRVMAEGARIRGQARETTVMFVDIVGFTALAEGADPEDVVSDLNAFFEIVIPAVERNGGHANKLLGDGMMAVFGVPTPLPDHSARAVEAALDIDEQLRAQYAGRLRAGVGLNSGTVVVGSMGGGGKLDYTIIGDAVNVAARVESMTRETGDAILATESTRALVPDHVAGFDTRGSVRLKGRRGEVALHAVRRCQAYAGLADPMGADGLEPPTSRV